MTSVVWRRTRSTMRNRVCFTSLHESFIFDCFSPKLHTSTWLLSKWSNLHQHTDPVSELHVSRIRNNYSATYAFSACIPLFDKRSSSRNSATTVYADCICHCGFWGKICISIFPSTTFIMFHRMEMFQCISYERFREWFFDCLIFWLPVTMSTVYAGCICACVVCGWNCI